MSLTTTKKKQSEKCTLKECIARPHLFKNTFQYQVAKFNNEKSQLILRQLSHVWMWELDYKESLAPKNWSFWTILLEKTLESP